MAIMLMGAAPSSVSDPEHTFSISVPHGWSLSSVPGDSKTVRVVAPEPRNKNGFRGNVGIEVLPTATNLTPERKKEFREQLSSLVPNLKFTGETETSVAGASGWKLSYRGQVRNVGIAGYSVVLSHGTRTWIVTFLTSVDAYPRQSADVDRLLKSFTIL